MEQRKPRRPAMLDDQTAERIVGDVDPALRSQAAHTTAAVLVQRGRAGAEDPELVARLVALVDTEGLDTVAELWSQSPPRTLPGALWRLYLMREWIRRDPSTIADRFALGRQRAEVAGVIAGVVEPPGPTDVARLADAVLAGVYEGDLDVALDRAAAFFRVVATGSALDADWIDDDDVATRLTRRAGALLRTAEDLEDAAELWRAGRLD
ncbi:hypothetical protein [uncultured Georgenia sp.]|uniref:hypothetical protein n=1 Tax=uncultured Georgenia sp. TaxID=378209 RepID=UPI002604416E|nr:hypothetical protein [uncultured Georgenia sp.]HLV05050.1 hypothetical protein [Actinomycetaceae bacterium]